MAGSLTYHPTSFDLDDFEASTSTEVGDDEFTTVERLPVEEGEGVYVGKGRSENPLQAEGSAEGNIKDDGDAEVNGKYRLVVLNSQNNIPTGGIITTGRISQLRRDRANSVDGDITTFQDIEVREPYKLGLQLKTKSGTATYSSSNSTFEVDGFLGEALN
jgi:hypothetical protein